MCDKCVCDVGVVFGVCGCVCVQREISHQVREKSQVKVKRVLSRTQSLGIGSLSSKFSAAKWPNRTIKLLSLPELLLSFVWDSSSPPVCRVLWLPRYQKRCDGAPGMLQGGTCCLGVPASMVLLASRWPHDNHFPRPPAHIPRRTTYWKPSLCQRPIQILAITVSLSTHPV